MAARLPRTLTRHSSRGANRLCPARDGSETGITRGLRSPGARKTLKYTIKDWKEAVGLVRQCPDSNGESGVRGQLPSRR